MDTLPWNPEAETALLGMILTQSQVLHRLPALTDRHFFEPVHQRIFAAVQRKLAAGDPVNFLSLKLEFEKDPDLAEAGGLKYLSALIGRAITPVSPDDLADEVISLARRRGLIEALTATLHTADTCPQVPFDELVAGLTGTLQEIGGGLGADRVRDNYEVTCEIIEDLKTRLPAVSTGLPRLDAAMGGGLYPGRSYGFAARKKVGKTVLASTISHNLNAQGVKHLFVAGEMGAREIHERNLSRDLRIPPSDFRGETRSDPKFLTRIMEQARRDNRCIIYHDAPGLTFDQLRRSVASAVYRHKITGVILDYWQLVGGKPKAKSTSEHLDEVAQWLADFCRQHKLWSVTMAQINQDGNTRGGEGIRLAFDQVYHLKGMGEGEDISQPGRWLQMLDTRYTEWMNVGTANLAGLAMNPHGPFFEQR